MSIKVLVADDHTMVREGLRALLNAKPDIEVVAEADNGRRALELVHEVMPDVVIMDVTMPDVNGIETTHQLSAEFPDVKVIISGKNITEFKGHGSTRSTNRSEFYR